MCVCVCVEVTDGVRDVIMYSSTTDKSKNRGFAFVEYESHKAAAMARRRLIPGTHTHTHVSTINPVSLYLPCCVFL